MGNAMLECLTIRTKQVAIITITLSILSACSDDKNAVVDSVKETTQTVHEKVIEAPVEKVIEEVNKAPEIVKETATNLAEPVADPKPEAVVEADQQKTEANQKTSQTAASTEVAPKTSNQPSNDVSDKPTIHYVKAVVTKFVPMVVFAKPGDQIVWTNMAGHDSTTLDGMIPEGAKAWHSKLGEQFSVTVDKEGAYIYKCTPHVSLGMLGAIVVGDGTPTNLDQLTNNPANKGMVKRTIRKMNQALEKR